MRIPEDKVDMCKAIETLINSERADENRKATENTLLRAARNMMKNLHLTVEQAFTALEVPVSDQPRLAGML